MRILYVSDIHYSLKQLDWLCAAAAGHDAIVIAGDLLDLAGHADVDTQTVVVAKYLKKLAATAPVAVCSGNHDLDAQSQSGERSAEWLMNLGLERVSVDLQSLNVDNCRFSVCSWWDGPESRVKVAEFLAREAKHDGRPWIWVYHASADGARTSWNGKTCSGDVLLSDLISVHKPDIVLSGHIHGSPFRGQGRWYDRVGDTWVFNPGRQPSSVPASIVIDLSANNATWTSEMDTQILDLASGIQSPGLG